MKGSTADRGAVCRRALIAGWALVCTLAAALPARAADDPWGADAQWGAVRFGYAKSGAEFAGDGAVGWGFSYTRFLHAGVAWTAAVQHDLLGRYNSASEVEIPLTVEFTKHVAWSESARPYFGLGWGAFFHKTYRTGNDESGFRQGIFLATGANGVIDKASLIGLDVRLVIEQDTRSINATFPDKGASGIVWSAKISYTRIL
ncbi:MAG: hypothetical protein HY076_07010 [Candidatus Eisenbacteria bacterium]|uniref:Outer membrane protein beta-barrel domain-containing protein n=1 Tax=Eiseniibacteriota bacterium TaxID=2212470 RepID=A0A9D6QK71_UNCEI|nr:hypothetical protein [Candidatus Eisenbacteria bacterium]MBI3540005.1 hypothetical protein [Candidatus Eisenbacteria bacterium]